MKYAQDIVQQAFAELDRRRQNAIAEHEAHTAEIQRNASEIYSVYLSIRETAGKLAAVVFSKAPNVRELVERIKNDNLNAQDKLKKLLKSFGYPENYLDYNYTCKKCSDTGVSNGNRCECVTGLLEKYSIEKLNEQCKIKLNNFADFNLSYYPETMSIKGSTIECREAMAGNLKYCMEYVKSFTPDSPGIFMLGATGLGKTFLSSCIAGGILSRGYSVAFDSVQNYLRAIEKEHFGKADGDTMEILLSADLLILDDLGCEFETSFNNSVIYNILNSRCNMGKPTIVSTNLTLQKLSDRYDDRIISRLTGNFKTIRFLGEDIRQIKRRQEIFN